MISRAGQIVIHTILTKKEEIGCLHASEFFVPFFHRRRC